MSLFDDPASMIPPSRPEAPPDVVAGRSLGWRNADDQFGVVRDQAHLRDLLSGIGSSRTWQWLRIADLSDEPEAFVQLCGQPPKGLIVELNVGDSTKLIASHDARELPRSQVGVHGWTYLAHPDERISLEDAISVVTEWLVERRVDDVRWEMRTTEGRQARRMNSDG